MQYHFGATMSHQFGYVEHLTDKDIELMGEAAGTDPPDLRVQLRESPEAFDRLVADARLFELVFEDPDPDLRVGLSPFLLFAILVSRAFDDLGSMTYVYEWTGPGKRLPVFDVDSLRDFLADAGSRLFLAEFLASFRRIASGTIRVRTRRGVRRQRYSELDPVRMSEMVDGLPAAQRPGGYRRLGDIALFLTGVFPDHTAGHPVPPVHREKLVRSAGLDPERALLAESDLQFLEELGVAWYRKAAEAARSVVGFAPRGIDRVADRFRPARRTLNYLADTYLHHYDGGLSRPA